MDDLPDISRKIPDGQLPADIPGHFPDKSPENSRRTTSDISLWTFPYIPWKIYPGQFLPIGMKTYVFIVLLFIKRRQAWTAALINA